MKEISDIVNQDDEVVGEDFRENIYQKGLGGNEYIRYVNVLIFNEDGLLLLPKRSSSKEIFPNCYDFSCGEHVESGESYDVAAKRGLFEELNLKDVELELLGKLSPRDGVSGFMQIYRAVIKNKKLKFNNEIQSLHWYKVDDVVKMTSERPSDFKDDLLIVLNWYLLNFS